ncbi:hypothetical protein VPH35_066303 [Triticum aestivum]
MSSTMANFPFDPTPFLLPGTQAIEVEGRPARACVIHGDVQLSNENLVIATLVPMPQGEVAFANVWEVLSDLLVSQRVVCSSISKCPFGQAFVRCNSKADKDSLINRSPHPFDDIHIIFQKHDQGLNWRKFNLARDCWLLLVGFSVDLRCMYELNNAVSSFGKLLSWDRAKTTDAAVAVKEELLGGGPPDEDPIHLDGNPHPRPSEQHHHPNKHNLFFGPIPQHENNEQPDNVQDGQNGEAENADDLGWDHWAMPPNNDNVLVQEQQIVAPQTIEMDHSGLALSLGIDSNSVESANSIHGAANLQLFGNLIAPHDQPVLLHEMQLPDLNMPLEVGLQQPEFPPALQHADLPFVVVQQEPNHLSDAATFLQQALQADATSASQVPLDQPTQELSDLQNPVNQLPNNTLADDQVLLAPLVAQEDSILQQELVVVATELQGAALDNPQAAAIPTTVNHTEGILTRELPSPNLDTVMQKMFLSQAHEELLNAYSGAEEAELWKKHFAPSVQPKEVIQPLCQNQEDKEVLPPTITSTPPSKTSSVGMSSSTSAIQVYKNRKDKAPLIESQIPEKHYSDDALHQAKKKKGSKDKEEKEKSKKGPKKGGLSNPA